ncbi:MAG: FecR domain-containing protein, partial [Pyrinomonadaceae bacterium]
MTNKLFKALSIAAIGVSIVSTVFGQNSRVVSAAGDKYVISAKAGGVNYTEGRVVIARQEGRSGQLLKGDEVQIGDRVETGADGRAEILLNPGSYMRVDRETAFSFVSTALDDLKIRLNAGSAIFEVIADDDFKVSVKAPKSNIDLIRSGVYRVDVAADGGAKISVWKGTAFVGANKTEVKAGRAATVNGETAIVAKFDRDQ